MYDLVYNIIRRCVNNSSKLQFNNLPFKFSFDSCVFIFIPAMEVTQCVNSDELKQSESGLIAGNIKENKNDVHSADAVVFVSKNYYYYWHHNVNPKFL